MHTAFEEKCQQCGYVFRKGDEVYDARTIWGPWATLCSVCFDSLGIGLGLGKGQLYHHGDAKKVAG